MKENVRGTELVVLGRLVIREVGAERRLVPAHRHCHVLPPVLRVEFRLVLLVEKAVLGLVAFTGLRFRPNQIISGNKMKNIVTTCSK